MKEILFLNMPDFDRAYLYHKEMGAGIGYKVLRSKKEIEKERKINPILDMINAASILKKRYNVYIDDAQFYEPKNFSEYKKQLKENFYKKEIKYIFVRTSSPSLKNDHILVNSLKKIFSNSLFFIFGPLLVSDDAIKYIKSKKIFDGIITSEIESVITDIIKSKNNKNLPSGVYYKYKNFYKINNVKRLLTNMESLPLLSYDLLNYKKINKFIINTQRGCPMACNYCPYYLTQGNKFRFQSPKRMVKEIKYLYKKFNAKKIVIHDPIFTLDMPRIIKFCDLLIKEKLPIVWECETHMQQINPNILKKMHMAGNNLMAFGVESADEQVLKKAGRRFNDWKKVKENIDYCKEIGITTRAYFIMAFDGDSIKGVFETIKLLKFLNPDLAQFKLHNLYLGTGAFKNAEKKGFIDKSNFDKFIENIGHHDGKEISLTKKISNSQAHLLWKIANHSVLLLKNKSFKYFSSKFKILIYTILVYAQEIKKIKYSNIF